MLKLINRQLNVAQLWTNIHCFVCDASNNKKTLGEEHQDSFSIDVNASTQKARLA